MNGMVLSPIDLNEAKSSAQIIQNNQTLRFEQYHMHLRPPGTPKLTLNIGHIVIFVVNQRIRNLILMKNNFHF